MDDLIVSGLRIDWNMLTDSYVSRIPSLRSIDELEFHKNVTFLVGENGSGKSTLLEGIAVAWPAHLGGVLLGLVTAGWLHVRRNPR